MRAVERPEMHEVAWPSMPGRRSIATLDNRTGSNCEDAHFCEKKKIPSHAETDTRRRDTLAGVHGWLYECVVVDLQGPLGSPFAPSAHGAKRTSVSQKGDRKYTSISKGRRMIRIAIGRVILRIRSGRRKMRGPGGREGVIFYVSGKGQK